MELVTPQYLKELSQTARRFRIACDLVQLEGSLRFAGPFPKGCCGDASMILGQYLHDQGFGTFTYVCGLKRDPATFDKSHAWLQKDGVIVDITADQFPRVKSKVLVTISSVWHRGWKLGTNSHDALLQNCPVERLAELLKAVMSKIEKI